MSRVVCDLELSEPLPDSIPLDGAGGVLAVLRRQGRPVGMVSVRATGWRVDAAALQAALIAVSAAPVAASTAHSRSPHHRPAPLSIIVCTRDRPADLARCLASLAPLVAAGHEVVVVDNAPPSDAAARVAACFDVGYTVEPRAGLDRARNRGLAAARHAIVAFTDDDVVVDAGWATAIAEPFASPAVGAATGLVVPLELATPAQELFEVYCAPRRQFARRTYAAPAVPPAAGGLAGMGANMAFRRDLLERLGGFDPRLDAGTATCSGGDTDMFARVLESGAEIVYTPDALVRHSHRRDIAALHACVRGYGIGLFAFLTKRLVEARDPRSLVIAARWLVGPFVRSARHRLRREPAVPLPLLLREAGGAMLGPHRFWQERRRAR